MTSYLTPQNYTRFSAGELSHVEVNAALDELLAAVGAVLPGLPSSVMRTWDDGATVANGTVVFGIAPYAGSIVSMDSKSSTGSFTASVRINTLPVLGLAAVAVSGSGVLNTSASGSTRSFNAGDTISAVITSATGGPTDAFLNLRITRS